MSTYKNYNHSINTVLDPSTLQQALANTGSLGTTLGYDPNYNTYPFHKEPTPEELAARDEYLRQRDLLDEEHRQKMDALKTFFPRGHDQIADLDLMVDIARQDQLNPLYEQVVKEFDEAKLLMSRAANKLASAVKLTDSEELATRKTASEALNKMSYGTTSAHLFGSGGSLYGNSSYGLGVTSNGASYTSNLIPGPVGPPGMMGPQGQKGDKGDQGPPGKPGAPYKSWITRMIELYKGQSK